MTRCEIPETALELDERYLRVAFDRVSSFTVGAEEELLLVDAAREVPVAAADQALALAEGDPRVVRMLHDAQIEVISPVCVAVADVTRELGAVRRMLAGGLAPEVLVVAAGAHPTADSQHNEVPTPLVLSSGLHVHVALGDADRALAVHNALRSYLPEIVALAANAPFLGGADSGLATVRPRLNQLGVPPAFASWPELAEHLRRARRSATTSWGLRLHPATATIEVRAADVQTRIADTGTIVALVQCLVYELAGRHDAGEEMPVHGSDRISEAMSLATRDGLLGALPDLERGGLEPAAERLLELADQMRPAAWALGCSQELEHVEQLVAAGGGATRQRNYGLGGAGLVRRLAEETSAGPLVETALVPG